MNEILIRPRAMHLRAALGSWRAMAWLGFLRFLRRDLPYPAVFIAGMLLYTARVVMPLWCWGWAGLTAYFASHGMWHDAAKAAFAGVQLPLVAITLNMVVRFYRWLNRPW